MRTISRRLFLRSGTLFTAGALTGLHTGCLSNQERYYFEMAEHILSENITIDLHSHAGALESRGIEDGVIFPYVGEEKEEQLFFEMFQSHLNCAYLNITSDWILMDFETEGNAKRGFGAGEKWAEYQRQIDIFRDPEFMAKMPIELATRVSDIEPISKRNKLAVFLSTEGGHMVEDDPELLSQLYADGIRKFQPIHYLETRLGDNQTDPPKYNGLSEVGREAIREATRLGMIIDVAHASFACTSQIAEVSQTPLILSHSMMLHGDYNHLRWISPDHAKLIADTGGVIGTWPVPRPHGFETLDDFVDATLKMIETVGIDHVGWSTDFIGGHLDDSPVLNRYSQFPVVASKLLARGLSEEELIKFIGGNALRVHREVVGS